MGRVTRVCRVWGNRTGLVTNGLGTTGVAHQGSEETWSFDEVADKLSKRTALQVPGLGYGIS
jgi:hypothetical protein